MLANQTLTPLDVIQNSIRYSITDLTRSSQSQQSAAATYWIWLIFCSNNNNKKKKSSECHMLKAISYYTIMASWVNYSFIYLNKCNLKNLISWVITHFSLWILTSPVCFSCFSDFAVVTICSHCMFKWIHVLQTLFQICFPILWEWM